jgi:predicted nucleic acid-binding protein
MRGAAGSVPQGMKALFDTNILIDYLNGVEAARTEIERAAERLVSIITWMEAFGGAHDDEEEVIDLFLRDFRVVDLTRRVAREGSPDQTRTSRPPARGHRLRIGPHAIRTAGHAQYETFPERRSRPSRAVRHLKLRRIERSLSSRSMPVTMGDQSR